MISAMLIYEFEEWTRVQGGISTRNKEMNWGRNTHQDVGGHPRYRRRGGLETLQAVCHPS